MRLFAAALVLAIAQDPSGKDRAPGSSGADDRWVAAYLYVRPGVELRKELRDMASVGIDIAVVVAGKGADPGPVARALQAAVDKNPRIKVKLAPFVDPAPASAGPLTPHN